MLKRLLAIAFFIVLLLALQHVDYGFYNPPVGVEAPGRDQALEDPHEREMLRVTVTAEDLKRFGGTVTLIRLSEFYGVADSLPCSVEKTFHTNDITVAQRPRPLNSTLVLCLN
jgi:hypothetical protein